MGLFSEPSAPVEPPSLRTLIVFLLIGMAMFLADVVLQRITGGGMDPAPYIRYLKSKMGEIYGLPVEAAAPA